MNVYLANTQGFCAGVANAIETVNRALEKFGAPLYVFHEIVHNTYVVEDFKKRGVVFVEKVSDVPQGARLIFSAHGVPPSVMEEARCYGLTFIDATCPLVTKVHQEAVQFCEKGYEIILIGHKGHQEIVGTSGYVDAEHLHIVENEKDIDVLTIASDTPVAYITQTTLSVDETAAMVKKLRDRFKSLVGPLKSDLCYATTNRQEAVKDLAKLCDIIIICGSPNSSNSNRLRETGAKQGTDSYIIDNADELDVALLKGKNTVGISSGASVPRIVVDKLVRKIWAAYPDAEVSYSGKSEKNVAFTLPKI